MYGYGGGLVGFILDALRHFGNTPGGLHSLYYYRAVPAVIRKRGLAIPQGRVLERMTAGRVAWQGRLYDSSEVGSKALAYLTACGKAWL